MGNLTIDSILKEILADPEGEKVLKKHIGPTLEHPHMQQAVNRTIRELMDIVKTRAPGRYPEEILDTIDKDLKKI